MSVDSRSSEEESDEEVAGVVCVSDEIDRVEHSSEFMMQQSRDVGLRDERRKRTYRREPCSARRC